jgi:hypothetical protein
MPIGLFWDLENCALPRGSDAFDLVQLLRKELVTDRGRQEWHFNVYCDTSTLDRKHQVGLHHAGVSLRSVPSTKPGAVDLALLLDLDRFTLAHKPPATIVLISGDIDFVGKLNLLRHQQGYHIILVHNAVAKRELKAAANQVLVWTHFTNQLQKPAAPLGQAAAAGGKGDKKQSSGERSSTVAAKQHGTSSDGHSAAASNSQPRGGKSSGPPGGPPTAAVAAHTKKTKPLNQSTASDDAYGE